MQDWSSSQEKQGWGVWGAAASREVAWQSQHGPPSPETAIVPACYTPHSTSASLARCTSVLTAGLGRSGRGISQCSFRRCCQHRLASFNISCYIQRAEGPRRIAPRRRLRPAGCGTTADTRAGVTGRSWLPSLSQAERKREREIDLRRARERQEERKRERKRKTESWHREL